MKSSRILAAPVLALTVFLAAETSGPQPSHDAAARPAVSAPRTSQPYFPTLKVRKILVPSNDPGKFKLRIDGIVRTGALGNNGATGMIALSPGVHTVDEIAAVGSGTNLADYTSVVSGDCGPSGAVSLHLGDISICTITNTRKTVGPHGAWTKGPGIYSFSVCSSGAQCTLVAPAGQPVSIKIETWGGGGGGGGGENAAAYGGDGGGGGGGGGYATTTVTVIPSTVALVYYVNVGNGGPGGKTIDPLALRQGAPGGKTYVRQGSATGLLLLQANGGIGGQTGTASYGYTGGAGGAGGSGTVNGTVNGWSGTAGSHGAVVTGCNGGDGGLGGAGGGPGRTGPGYFNDGGHGGHGGYYNGGLFSCNSRGMDYLLSEGVPGGSGRVNLSW